MPVLTNPTDFNDKARIYGLGAVAADIDNAVPVMDEAPKWDYEAFENIDVPLSAAPSGNIEPLPVKPAEWPDPILPGQVKTPTIPTDVLPDWMAAMAQAVSASTQTPPALAVMTGLAVLATVLQRRFEVSPWPDYTEPLSIFTLSASPSGTRKSAVLNAMLGPLVHWEKLQRDRMRSDIAKNIALRAVAKKRIEKLQQDAAKAKDATEREQLTNEIQS